MGIALVCDLPGCGEVISPEETEAILDRFGDEKPPAIKVEIDGETAMLLDDVCPRHRDEFRALLVSFASERRSGAVAEPKTASKPAPVGKKPEQAMRPRREKVKLPDGGGIEKAMADIRERSEAAAEIAVPPSSAFGAVEAPAEAAPEEPKPKAEAKPKAASGPKPFKRTAERRPEQAKSQKKGGPVSATIEVERETIIEPSLASVYDFSDTTPAV